MASKQARSELTKRSARARVEQSRAERTRLDKQESIHGTPAKLAGLREFVGERANRAAPSEAC